MPKDIKKKDEQTEEEHTETEEEKILLKCRNLETQSKENRRKFDWEWLVRTLYVRGYHFARYNRGTNTVVFSTRTGVRIPINLVNAHLRGVRNQVTSFQPKWEVLPKVTAESAIENARYSGKILDFIYEKAQIKRKVKEIVTDALMYSVGIWQFDTDRDGNVSVNRVDPFDFLVDPNVKSSNLNDPEYGAEYVILSHQVPIEMIRKNPKFSHVENLQADNEVASAEYKRFLLQVTNRQFQSQTKENETKILKQAWLRERNEDGFKIKIVTYVDGMDVPLLVEETDETEFPFEVLQGDITQGNLYGESWIKHLIPINRVIDALESHIFEYNHFFAKGRFVVDKNSGVRIIVNEHGQIIEKNRGSTVTPITVPPLPPSPDTQIIRMKAHLEDTSGVHDVSLGRLPGSLRSGTAIAELKQADATNQADLVDNMEDFLARSGKKILKLVSEEWNTSKLVSVTGIGGKPEYFMAAGEGGASSALKSKNKKGEKFSFGSMKLPIAIIGADNEVRVQIGSWLAYTKEARQEKLKEMFRLGAIDQKTYLEHSEFADIDSIVSRTRDEANLQAKRGKPNQGLDRDFGVQMDDESLALSENELMTDGTDQPVYAEDDHELHLSIHGEEKENDLVRAHINEHIKVQRFKRSAETGPAPQEEQGQPGGGPQIPGQPVSGGIPNGQGGVPGGLPPEMADLLGGR